MCIVLKWFYNKDQFVLVLEIKKWKVYLIQVFHESVSDLTSFYRKIHYLTREFHVKLHAKTDRDSCDIGFQVQFNVEFSSQVMNFP